MGFAGVEFLGHVYSLLMALAVRGIVIILTKSVSLRSFAA
jgi:hypothetical protein